MNGMPDRSDAALTRLMDIYKVHVQQLSNISNQRLTTHRFYQLLLSGMLVVFVGFMQHGSTVLPNVSERCLQNILLNIRFAGVLIAWVWAMTTNSSLRLVARKGEVLKELEAELDYRFFTREWEFSDAGISDRNYGDVSRYEYYVPVFICGMCASGFFWGFKPTHWTHYGYIVVSALAMIPLLIEMVTSLVKKDA